MSNVVDMHAFAYRDQVGLLLETARHLQDTLDPMDGYLEILTAYFEWYWDPANPHASALRNLGVELDVSTGDDDYVSQVIETSVAYGVDIGPLWEYVEIFKIVGGDTAGPVLPGDAYIDVPRFLQTWYTAVEQSDCELYTPLVKFLTLLVDHQFEIIMCGIEGHDMTMVWGKGHTLVTVTSIDPRRLHHG